MFRKKGVGERLFESLMRSAIGADGDPAVSPGDLDVEIGVADGGADLVPGPSGGEDAVGTGDRDKTFAGQAGGDAHHVLFGDADAEHAVVAFGVPGFEIRDANGA